MVDVNDIYKTGEYLKAEDIGNQFWTFTIKSADVKKFNDGTSKIILMFWEWEKGLPLNVTNARSIAEMYGNNSNAWIDHQVMLFTMRVDFNGQQKLAIRIRAPQQVQQMPAPPMHPAPRQPGQLQPGQPAPQQPAYNPALNSPQRPLNPQQQPQNFAPLPAGAQPFAPIGDDPIPF